MIATNYHIRDKNSFEILKETQEFHNSAITQCKFNNSGSLVASGDADGVVKVWSTSPAPRYCPVCCVHFYIKKPKFSE
jgi:WD40 repeat protein